MKERYGEFSHRNRIASISFRPSRTKNFLPSFRNNCDGREDAHRRKFLTGRYVGKRSFPLGADALTLRVGKIDRKRRVQSAKGECTRRAINGSLFFSLRAYRGRTDNIISRGYRRRRRRRRQCRTRGVPPPGRSRLDEGREWRRRGEASTSHAVVLRRQLCAVSRRKMLRVPDGS